MENAIQESKRARFSDALNGITLYGRLVAKTAIRPIAVIEVAAYMVLILVLFYFIHPQDPLLLMLPFPWVWLVATALALRYGALLGVMAGLIVVLDWELLYRGYHGAGPMSFPVMFMSGGLILVIMAGHVRDVWANIIVRADGINSYLNDQLASLTTAHFLLRTSHDRLERDLFTRPATLRGAIEKMREVVPLAEGQRTSEGLEGAQKMLELVVMICQINSATVYPISANGEVNNMPVAHVGDSIPLDRGDLVLQDCLERQLLAHLQTVDADRLDSYYIAAPIMVATGEIAGVLVVNDVTFMSLNHDNMQLLLVLLDYYGDSLIQQQLVAPVQRVMPRCPFRFAAELERVSHLKQIYDIDSSLVGLSFPRTGPGDLQFQQVTRQLRALDLVWVDQIDKRQFAIFLMPLTEENGVTGYLKRIESNLQSSFNTTMAGADIRYYSLPVSSGDVAIVLKNIHDQVRAS